MPEGMNWKNIAGVSLLGGIGFTVSLFIANLSFGSTYPILLNQAKFRSPFRYGSGRCFRIYCTLSGITQEEMTIFCDFICCCKYLWIEKETENEKTEYVSG